jgi:hypothetical protein
LPDVGYPTHTNCEGGESPLECEQRLTQLGVVHINIGYHDALQSTNPNSLTSRLQEVVQIAVANGVIPVISTKSSLLDGSVTPEQIQAVNDLILEVANQNQIPVLNLWRAFVELPDSGLSANGAASSVSPNGPGDLTTSAVSTYDANARNYYILTMLDTLRGTL